PSSGRRHFVSPSTLHSTRQTVPTPLSRSKESLYPLGVENLPGDLTVYFLPSAVSFAFLASPCPCATPGILRTDMLPAALPVTLPRWTSLRKSASSPPSRASTSTK